MATRRWMVFVCCLGLTLGLTAGPTGAVADDDEAVAPTSVDDPLLSFQRNLTRIRATEAWELTRGAPDVTIAIVDTGVDPEHQDLAGAFWTHPETGAKGYDHLRRTSSSIYVDPGADWHGTAVAGIAAARADDGYGMAGVAPEVSVMVHRIYASASSSEPPTQSSYTLATTAIRDATAAGADVILLPWGGTVADDALLSALQDADVPVVAAAGNDGQDLTNDPSIVRFPAMYRLPNLVTVAASDYDGGLLDKGSIASNSGVRHVDIAAPGDGLISIVADAEHGIFDGSSFAAPQVAGALALGRTYAPDVPANELVAMLIGTAQRSASLDGKVTSGGVLDVLAFLRSLERPVCVATIPPADFPDLERSALHVENIDCIVWYGISQGTGDGFAPSRTITRGETATLLVRVMEAAGHDVPDQPRTSFDDIDGTTHELSIGQLADMGFVSGVGDGRFAPHRPVTRGQMATMIVGVLEELTELDLPTDRDWFDDIGGSAHASSILKAREAGITLGGADPRRFDPANDMTRGQMASFLARMLDAAGREDVSVEPAS